MTYNGKGNIQYNLSSKPLAAGGEGEIYDITGQSHLVAKLYKPGKIGPEKERKLIRMVNFPPDKSVLTQIAWPHDVLYNAGQFVGFVMPKMKINEDLNVIYEYGSSAKYSNMQWENRIIIAKNLCVVLHYIHDSGYVCGDLNPKNISVDPRTGFVVFLDTDSYHIEDGKNIYRCDVGMPEYLPVEIQRKMRGGSNLATAALPTFSKDTDNFALAVHIFQLLMNGVHPFACAIIPSQSSVTAPMPSDNIESGEFPFMQNISGIRIPVFAPKITILPKDIQDLFKRAFIDGHNSPSVRPKPDEWHTALDGLAQSLKTCNKIAYHQYYKSLSSCPWCEANESFNKALSKNTFTQTQIKPLVAPAPSLTPLSPIKQKTYSQTQSGSGYSLSSQILTTKLKAIIAWFWNLPTSAKVAIAAGVLVIFFMLGFSASNGRSNGNSGENNVPVAVSPATQTQPTDTQPAPQSAQTQPANTQPTTVNPPTPQSAQIQPVNTQPATVTPPTPQSTQTQPANTQPTTATQPTPQSAQTQPAAIQPAQSAPASIISPSQTVQQTPARTQQQTQSQATQPQSANSKNINIPVLQNKAYTPIPALTRSEHTPVERLSNTSFTVPKDATILQYSGNIREDKQIDNYTYTAPTSGRYRFELSGQSSGTSVDIYVLDSSGKTLNYDTDARNGDGVTVEDIRAGSTYTIRVSQRRGKSSYKLSVK